MSENTEPVLAAKGVGMRFQGLHALADVTMEVPPDSIMGLIGPNGAGKTTLVNVLSGLVVPTSGEVRRFGKPVRQWGISRAARSGVCRTFQASTVIPEFTVLQNIEVAALHASGQVDVLEIIDRLQLGHRAAVLAGELAFGELRRLGVAIALATGPKVVLLDEPGAGLTGTDLDLLSAIIRRIRDSGTAVLLVDHNMRFLMNTVDRVVVLEGGRVIAQGTPMEIQRDERVLAAYLGRSAHA